MMASRLRSIEQQDEAYFRFDTGFQRPTRIALPS
jgi:hypothetical protein